MLSARVLPVLVSLLVSSVAFAAAPTYVINKYDQKIYGSTDGFNYAHVGSDAVSLAASGRSALAITKDAAVWYNPDPIANGDGWTKIGVNVQEVALSGTHGYAINNQDHQVYAYTGNGMDWTPIAKNGKHIAASGDGLYLITTDENVWHNPNPNGGGTWTRIGVQAALLAVSGTNVYVTNSAHRSIWRYNGVVDSWNQVGSDTIALAASGDVLYAVTSNGNVFRSTEAVNKKDAWTQIGVRSSQIAVAGSDVYVVNNQDQGVWKWRGSGMDWDQVGTDAAAITVAP